MTGGARRLGRELSLALAHAGADVAISHHRSDDEAASLAGEIRALGRRALVVRADLAEATAADAVIAAVHAGLGRLDILVNSASRFDAASLDSITSDAWDTVMAVNLRAPFLLARAGAPLLRQDGGVIINIADLSAFQVWRDYPHHAVSKAGLVHLTRVLARLLAPEIRVNAIVPATVLPPPDFDDEEIERIRTRIPLGRLGSPADVVRALLYLVDADFVTGEVTRVDGGRLLG